MLTQKDINLLKSSFVTKDEFNEFRSEANSKFSSIDVKLDKLITQADANAGALKAIQEELAIKKYRADQLEEHEERLLKLFSF